MDVVRPDQIITLTLFLAVLGLGWLVVKLNKGGLVRRISGDRRLHLAEVTALSPTDRAMILRVDGREFLVLRCKGQAPLLHDLGTAPATISQLTNKGAE